MSSDIWVESRYGKRPFIREIIGTLPGIIPFFFVTLADPPRTLCHEPIKRIFYVERL